MAKQMSDRGGSHTNAVAAPVHDTYRNSCLAAGNFPSSQSSISILVVSVVVVGGRKKSARTFPPTQPTTQPRTQRSRQLGLLVGAIKYPPVEVVEAIPGDAGFWLGPPRAALAPVVVWPWLRFPS
jgi:hypothetical protein